MREQELINSLESIQDNLSWNFADEQRTLISYILDAQEELEELINKIELEGVINGK